MIEIEKMKNYVLSPYIGIPRNANGNKKLNFLINKILLFKWKNFLLKFEHNTFLLKNFFK